jgi:hypothetical protein
MSSEAESAKIKAEIKNLESHLRALLIVDSAPSSKFESRYAERNCTDFKSCCEKPRNCANSGLHRADLRTGNRTKSESVPYVIGFLAYSHTLI